MSPNTELLASIADVIRVSAPSHTVDLLIAARNEIARLNSENAKLAAQVAVASRRTALTAVERVTLQTALKVGAQAGALDALLSKEHLGRLQFKLEGGRRA